MDGGDKSPESIYQLLLDRFRSLEASHHKLKEQFQVVLQEKPSHHVNVSINEEREEATPDSDDVTSLPGWGDIPATYTLRSPYRSVLECMGHAVHVSKIGSAQIIYWNRAAEKLFGYKNYEVLGQSVVELLFDEEHHHSAMAIMQTLSIGRSWSGQLPLKKRSGQNFMALVTQTPFYEDGELAGIVAVSSDAAVFNNTSSRNNEQPKVRRINFKKIQWHSRPQIAAVPQLASSVSNLASKVLSRKHGDVTSDTPRPTRECDEAKVESHDVKVDRPPRAPITKPAFSFSIGRSRTEAMSFEKEESASKFAQPSKIAVKFFRKLHTGAISNLEKVVDENIQPNGSEDYPVRKEAANVTCSFRDPMESISQFCNLDARNHAAAVMIGTFGAAERKHTNIHMNPSVTNESSSRAAFLSVCQGCLELHRSADQLPRSSLQSDGGKSMANVPNMKSVNPGDPSPRQSGSHKIPSAGECFGGEPGSLSSKGENDSHMVDSVIRWEDLQLKEEIGQGSFAVVFRGVWNGSDVAVKVYSGNQYSEEILRDSKKEIDIMRRLRHPNVLLFMGAVFSEERIAMVTEYMIRGSLFKTLHKSNQSLDIRRRLRMAIDVARGMNYLHRRNPPIVHRDLKSSNLLVDKSWTVKVGDFGLSKLKYATFLTAISGRGTPQWMAPEVLRNEPSTEKSDVFSFGVILWELMTESIPWSDLNALQVVGVVGFMDRRLDLPKNIDPQISSIISECWQSNPEDRPSFEHIIRNMTSILYAGKGTAKSASTL